VGADPQCNLTVQFIDEDVVDDLLDKSHEAPFHRATGRSSRGSSWMSRRPTRILIEELSSLKAQLREIQRGQGPGGR